MEVGKLYFMMLGTRDIFGKIARMSDVDYVVEYPCLLMPSQKGMQIVPIDFVGEITELIIQKSAVDAHSEAGKSINEMWSQYSEKQRAKKSGIILDMPRQPIFGSH